MKIQNVILSFPSLFTPKGFATDPNSKPAYSASFLMDKGSEQEAAIRAAMLAAATAKWPKDGAKQLALLEKQGKVCLRDGDDKSFDGYEGRVYLAARNPKAPILVGRDPYLRNDDGTIVQDNGRPVANLVTEEQGLLYAGAKVHALVTIYAQDSNFGKRINAVLEGVQFVSHGDAFGASAPRVDAFDVLDAAGAV